MARQQISLIGVPLSTRTLDDVVANAFHARPAKDVLFGELRHRMKNLLAMVQALARQTTAEGRSGEEYRDAFLGRFNALVRAHDLAFSEQGDTGLHELVERTLEPYASDSTAVVVEPGPAVALASGQVVSLNLILHELATNAVKHGALSAPKGQVRVRLHVDEASGRACSATRR